MADEKVVPGTQVVPPATPQPDTQVVDGQAAQEEEPFDKERALATIRKLRETEKQAKADAKRLAELEAQVKAQEDAKLSEVEKAKKDMVKTQAQVELLSAELRAERVARAIERSAIKLGLDPELASSLVKSDELEFDDAGLPTNAEKVLEALVKRWPQLVSKPADAQAALGGGKPRPAITATPKPVLPGQKLSDEERRKRAWHPRNL